MKYFNLFTAPFSGTITRRVTFGWEYDLGNLDLTTFRDTIRTSLLSLFGTWSASLGATQFCAPGCNNLAITITVLRLGRCRVDIVATDVPWVYSRLLSIISYKYWNFLIWYLRQYGHQVFNSIRCEIWVRRKSTSLKKIINKIKTLFYTPVEYLKGEENTETSEIVIFYEIITHAIILVVKLESLLLSRYTKIVCVTVCVSM